MQLEVESLQVPLWSTEDDQLFWSAATSRRTHFKPKWQWSFSSNSWNSWRF